VALNYVTITGTFDDGSGSPVSPVVTFTPSATVYASGVPVAIEGAPVVASIANGALKNAAGSALQLLATDNAGLTVEGQTGFWYWTVNVNFGPNSPANQEWSFFLPHSPATVDLYALANTVAGGGGFTSPMTTLGDLITEDGTPTAVRLPGNTSATRKFLRQQGNGTISAAPAWDTLQAGDVPYKPWQFYVGAYGAKGNGKIATGGAITTGTAALTLSGLTSADAGKSIHVGGAGGGTYSPLGTTISSAGTGTATLAASATSTVSNAIVYYGSDDTAAINAAVTAAVAYAQANNGYAEVVFDPVMYILGGAPTIGGATLGNAQIPLPDVSRTGQKVTLVFRGTRDQTALPHWLQTIPQASGTVLACTRNDGTNDATYGPAAVIGGPYAGRGAQSGGGGTAVFSNILPVIDGIGVMVPYNGTYGGFDFYGCAEANVINGSCFAAAIVPTGSAVPDMATPSNLSNFTALPIGLRMPSQDNNDNCNIGWFSVEGIINGFRPSEHTHWDSLRIINCRNGMVPYVGNGETMHHAISSRGYCSIENCANGIIPTGTDSPAIDIYVDFEACTVAVNDATNNIFGSLHYRSELDAVTIGSGAANLRVISLDQASGAWSGQPAVPASTVAQQNTSWRDAAVSIKGGTVTVVAVDGVTVATASNTTVIVPSGKNITLTYSVAPTWAWTLL
jgi:hypothetical protein